MGHRVGPSSGWYLLSILGIGVSALALYSFWGQRLETMTADLARVPVPGQVELPLPGAGDYLVYLEYRSVIDNQLFLTPEDLGDLEVVVAPVAGGEPLDLFTPIRSVRYDRDGRAGYSIASFSIDEPSTYLLSGRYPPGAAGSRMVLAVGPGVMGDWSIPILGGFALALAPGLAGFVGVVLTWRARVRARKRQWGVVTRYKRLR
jgi:hypothetical protein